MSNNTIVKADIEYSDGTKATFTGDPLDITTIPTQSPDQQSAEQNQGGESEEENTSVPAEAENGSEVPDRNHA